MRLLTATLVNTMARSVRWRRECSDIVRRRIEEALQITLYIVHQTGPTGFIVKEDGRSKKMKVLIECIPTITRNCVFHACLSVKLVIPGVPG